MGDPEIVLEKWKELINDLIVLNVRLDKMCRQIENAGPLPEELSKYGNAIRGYGTSAYLLGDALYTLPFGRARRKRR